MDNNVVSRVRKLISENIDLAKSIEEIEDSEDLMHLGMDSVSSMKLIVAIEQEFEFEFDDEALNFENFRTIERLTAYIESRL